jgi:hypothetical protein
VTERWRKRLGDLDKAAPSDDVLARAKDGPRLPEEALERPSRGARAVTAVAAFLIFALAISVFAIPALRLRSGAGGAPPGGLQPLWPFQTLEEVEEYEQDPVPIGSMGSEAFLDAQETAWAFGYEVLGWDDGDFQVFETTLLEACRSWPATMPPGATMPPTVAGGGVATSECIYGPVEYPSSAALVPLGTDPASGPSPSARFRTFSLLPTCRPGTFCGPTPGASVTAYQPLGMGDGRAWAVIEATSEQAELAVRPGSVLRPGTAVSGNVTLSPGTRPILGIQLGDGGCDVNRSDTAYMTAVGAAGTGAEVPAGLGIELDLPARPAGCDPIEPGHVFIAVVEAGPDDRDPLIVRRDEPLVAIAAVPVVVEWPDAPPRPTGSIGVEPREPVGYWSRTDRLGWSIDVPTDWSVETSSGVEGPAHTKAFFYSGTLDAGGGPSNGEVLLTISHGADGPVDAPADDSSFPLSFDNLEPNEGGHQLSFRGDGLAFILDVRGGPEGELSADQEAIVRHMIASIRFEPWESRDTRNGWSVVDPWSEQDPLAGAAGIVWAWVWVDEDRGWAGVYVPDENVVLGPMPTDCCDQPRYTASTDPRGPLIACPGGLDQGWTVEGSPFPTNPIPFQHTVDVHPVITAWDGTLLTSRNYTV